MSTDSVEAADPVETKLVEYYGTADFKEYTAADFKKAGIENAKKVVFQPATPIELPAEVADALVSKEGLFGEELFKEIPREIAEGDDYPDVQEANADASKAKKGSAAKSVPSNPGATAQESTDAGAGTAGTGGTTVTSPPGA